jgi:hypothetical protein
LRARIDLLRRAREIRENDFIDPSRPQDGPVFFDDGHTESYGICDTQNTCVLP